MKREKKPHGYYRKRKEHCKKLSRLVKKRMFLITGRIPIKKEDITPIIVEPPVFELQFANEIWNKEIIDENK